MTDRTAPKLSRPTFWVWIAPEGVSTDADPDQLTVHRAVVTSGDQLRAELEGKKQGLGDPRSTPMHLTVLWIWAALVRAGVVDQPFQVFSPTVAAYEPEDDDDEATVDPTGASTD